MYIFHHLCSTFNKKLSTKQFDNSFKKRKRKKKIKREICSHVLTGHSLFSISLDTWGIEEVNMKISTGRFVQQLKRHLSSCPADLHSDR